LGIDRCFWHWDRALELRLHPLTPRRARPRSYLPWTHGKRAARIRCRVQKGRDLWLAAGLSLAAVAASQANARCGEAALRLSCRDFAGGGFRVGDSRRRGRALDDFIEILGKIFEWKRCWLREAVVGSLRRTSVLVGALSTAIAMMTAVGIMVGSFRETVPYGWAISCPPISTFDPRVRCRRSSPDYFPGSGGENCKTSRSESRRSIARLRNQLREHACDAAFRGCGCTALASQF